MAHISSTSSGSAYDPELSKTVRKLEHVLERNEDVLKDQRVSKTVRKVKDLCDKALAGDEEAARRLETEGVEKLQATKEKVALGMEEQLRMDDESPAPISEEVEEIKHDYEEAHRRLTQALPAEHHSEEAAHDAHREKIRK
jgi:hypothetical protein